MPIPYPHNQKREVDDENVWHCARAYLWADVPLRLLSGQTSWI